MKVLRGQRLITGLLVAALATALSILAVRTLSFLAGIENFASDIRVAAMQPPMPQSKDIVIVALDEATLSQFPYRSPVDRAFLADLLGMLDQKGAKAIGVDIIFDQPTETTKDAALRGVFKSMKTPHFIAYTSTPAIVNQSQLGYLDRFVDPTLRAEANVLSDPLDGSVRWINPGGTTPDRPPRLRIQGIGARREKHTSNADRNRMAQQAQWRCGCVPGIFSGDGRLSACRMVSQQDRAGGRSAFFDRPASHTACHYR
jgi:hypothetical protein